MLLHSTAPPSSHSSALGNARGLSLPSRIEIYPEWDVVELPVHAIHLSGVGNEKADPLLRSASIARSFSWNPFRFNLTEVVICPSPANVRTRSLIDFPTE